MKRWLCLHCRDDRAISGQDVAKCMPGQCPALQRLNDINWHRADYRGPGWFRKWAVQHRDFWRWPTNWKLDTIHQWFPELLDGTMARKLSDAQEEARTSVDPIRERPTTLPDDSRLETIAMRNLETILR